MTAQDLQTAELSKRICEALEPCTLAEASEAIAETEISCLSGRPPPSALGQKLFLTVMGYQIGQALEALRRAMRELLIQSEYWAKHTAQNAVTSEGAGGYWESGLHAMAGDVQKGTLQ